MPDTAPQFSFAPARAEDFESLHELRLAAMRPSLEAVGRFDPVRSRERFRASFSPELTQRIVVDDMTIGFFALRALEDFWWLDHFYIHPEWQGRGVGGRVLDVLIAKADDAGKPVELNALRDSPSNRFYRRHGFVQTGESEWDIHYRRATG
jgi:GNAT superfamily N-acetyltransferase